MVAFAGASLLVLGLASGLLLLLAPFGIGPATPGVTAWVLFPAFTVVGYVLLAVAARIAVTALISRVAGACLVLLALGPASHCSSSAMHCSKRAPIPVPCGMCWASGSCSARRDSRSAGRRRIPQAFEGLCSIAPAAFPDHLLQQGLLAQSDALALAVTFFAAHPLRWPTGRGNLPQP